MSISWQRNVAPKPAILVLPPDAASLDEAHGAIELWEHYSHKTLDGTQRLTVEVMMAESAGRRWAARTTGREMPRQNGKGDELEVVELWGLVQRGEAIFHSAHELMTVSSAHERMASLLNNHADLRRRIKKILNGLGQQMIELTNGGVIAYRTRTNGGGRGLDDISRLVIDEAQHAKPEQLASCTPILLANPNPQMNFVGTGGIAGVSDWWWEVRKRALGATPGQFGYVGHTAERVSLDPDGKVVQESVDPEDRALWMAANPALHAGRGEVEFFEEQLRTLGPVLFGREHLGVWDPPPDADTSRLIPVAVWESCAEPRSAIESHKAWALSVSADRKFASFGIAGRRLDGRLHVETMTRKPGTDWIVAAAVDFYGRTKIPLRIHKAGAEAAFIAVLIERGVKVEEVSSAELAQATGQFADAANGDQLRHLDQSTLNLALRQAPVNTSRFGALTWDDRNVEISSLMAVTVAAGGVPSVQTSGGLFLAVT